MVVDFHVKSKSSLSEGLEISIGKCVQQKKKMEGKSVVRGHQKGCKTYTTNPSHSHDAENFSLGVSPDLEVIFEVPCSPHIITISSRVQKEEKRSGKGRTTTGLGFGEREIAQGRDDEVHCRRGGCVVNGGRGVGDADSCGQKMSAGLVV